jgi:short-subunit dehydrogenase
MKRLKAILVGNSDGIGLATTKRLLLSGWDVVGISRSKSPITDRAYRHCVMDVSATGYQELLHELVQAGVPDLCVYFVGIGEMLNLANMKDEARVLDANLCCMVKTAAVVIPGMVKRGRGHFMGLSSLADKLPSAEAPSYSASKAGFSSYLWGLARAVRQSGVHVTNVRFGFVDTKMAKSKRKPFMMSVERAADHLEICIRRKPICYTAPRFAIPLIAIVNVAGRLQDVVWKARRRLRG